MRIAQVAPLYERVPPRFYGGTERVVCDLTEELVRLGHDVTLFASADSLTSARLVGVVDEALRLSDDGTDPSIYHALQHELVAQRANEFDIIHFHLDGQHLPLMRRVDTPYVTTLHGRLDLPGLAALFREFPEVPMVSISDSQRAPLTWLSWQGTVAHGIPLHRYTYRPVADGYLAFLGRISREKRVDRAIEIAHAVGMPLRIAAKIDDADREYYEREVAHLFRDPAIEYIGEVGETEKDAFLGGAMALLFPIDWEEPFGLVMIEAMATGTPVVAWRRGSVPEVIDEGQSGFIVDNLPAAIDAVRRAGDLARATVRRTFELRFSVERMARDYLAIYESLVRQVAADEREALSVVG